MYICMCIYIYIYIYVTSLKASAPIVKRTPRTAGATADRILGGQRELSYRCSM